MGLIEYEPGTAFPGVIGRTADESSPAWPQPVRATPRRAERDVHRAGRHRVRPARLLRQPDRHAELRRARRGRPALHQHAHHALCSPSRSCIITGAQPPQQRDGGHQRDRHRLSRVQRRGPVRERVPVRDAPGRTATARSWSASATCCRRSSSPRSARSTAGRWPRLRALLRVPGRRHQPVVSGPGLRQPPGRAAATPEEGYHLNADLVDRPSSSSPTPSRSPRTSRSTCISAPGPRTPRTTCRGSGPTSTRASSTTAGTPTGSGSSPGRRSSASCRPTPSCPGTTPTCPPGSRCPRTAASSAARMMEVFAGFLSHTDHHVGPGARLPEARPASSTTR